MVRRTVPGPLADLEALRATVRAASDAVDDPRLAAYLERVADRAWTITDDEVAALSTSGVDDDAIFEATVVTALDAALARLRAGIAALDEAD